MFALAGNVYGWSGPIVFLILRSSLNQWALDFQVRYT